MPTFVDIVPYIPSKFNVFFGSHCVSNNVDQLKLGGSCAIVTGRSSAVKSGALNDVTTSLAALNISYTIFNEIEQNPLYSTVFKAFENLPKVDFIIAIGGGSPMDASKLLSVMMANHNPGSISEEDMQKTVFTTKYEQNLPLVCITTTCGSGSEVTPYAVITDTIHGNKRNLATPVYPTVSFVDPLYLTTLPRSYVISTALDALSHLIEPRMTVKGRGDEKVCELVEIGLGMWKSLFSILDSDTSSLFYHDLALMQLIGGLTITFAGTTIVHAVGYCLTFHLNVLHGVANSLVMPAFFEFYKKYDSELVDLVLLQMGLSSISQFKTTINSLLVTLPREYVTVEIKQDDIEMFSKKVLMQKNKLETCPYEVTDTDIKKIYESI
ncbi:hypothetical protein P9112_006643 [Eukaryota sp. TZLM1-RC]